MRFRVRPVLLLVALLLTTAVLLLLLDARRRADSYPLGTLPPVSFWYWHTPFALTDPNAKTVEAMGVRELFVRTATLTYSGDKNDPVRVVLRQTWAPSPDALRPVKIHLVFPVDATLVRRFETFPDTVFANSLVRAIGSERKRAVAQSGLNIAGVQLDLDCPTRLLPRYADVLKQLRPRLFQTDALSITLLTSWYDSRALGGLLDVVDFSVPQFYEAQTSTTRSGFHPISDPVRFVRGLHQAERMGKPFYVGLPIYGHAMVYDNKQRLRGLFHDASAADLINRPQEFGFLGTAPLNRRGRDAQTPADFIGEERVEFGPAHGGSAFRLTYDLPTWELLRRHLAVLRGERLPHTCRGIILYRFPERDEEAVLPIVSVAAVLRGEAPRPDLQIGLRARQTAPFDLVEASPSALTPPRTDLYLTVTNVGNGAVGVAPDAVQLVLHFEHAVLESTRSGDAKGEGFVDTPNHRASVFRANGLRFFLAALPPGKRRVIGPITFRPTGPATIRVQWRVRLPGGFETAGGELPPTPLTPAAKVP